MSNAADTPARYTREMFSGEAQYIAYLAYEPTREQISIATAIRTLAHVPATLDTMRASMMLEGALPLPGTPEARRIFDYVPTPYEER